MELGHFLLLPGHPCRKTPLVCLSNPRTICGGAEAVKDKSTSCVRIAMRTISLVLACVALAFRAAHGGSSLSQQLGLLQERTMLVSFLGNFLSLLLCGSGETGPLGCITRDLHSGHVT